MRIPHNRQAWSASSQRSVVYDSPNNSYEDIIYDCLACGSPAIFTAQAQQHTYEVKKKYIWQRRILCNHCHAAWYRLRQQERACQARWATDRHQLQDDRVFLQTWLTTIQTIKIYQPRYTNSMVQRLQHLLINID